ncbi:hypothetical protein [Haloarchaeobius sp. HME9146]|uniref:hypothetical protein n=1 Tax=Haloarchaeobius sp. HME9146 TaxID=2978732 RepID=UPI0021BEE13C|nr:hypothetical protein [Haloarchaeobius sp. HME9146]MCT9096944.1 hypothetical protein [Haloarchaeobius sp. HME9146]
MSIWVTLAKAATVANVALLLALGYVWGRNFLKFRSKHTMGLLIFSAFLLAENLLVLYYYQLDPTLSAWWHTDSMVPRPVWQAQMLLHVMQTFGLGFLAWVSWD